MIIVGLHAGQSARAISGATSAAANSARAVSKLSTVRIAKLVFETRRLHNRGVLGELCVCAGVSYNKEFCRLCACHGHNAAHQLCVWHRSVSARSLRSWPTYRQPAARTCSTSACAMAAPMQHALLGIRRLRLELRRLGGEVVPLSGRHQGQHTQGGTGKEQGSAAADRQQQAGPD